MLDEEKAKRASLQGRTAFIRVHKEVPKEAVEALMGIGNLVPKLKAQPASWLQITILVLPKEADSYTTHKFCLISLLNTDYKIVMRVWANRLGPILARKIGHHQRGFILGRDGIH
jgi:hypothetical protein